MKRKYRVTRRFLTGTLIGMTYTDETDVEFRVGQVIPYHPWCGPSYVIIAVEPLE